MMMLKRREDILRVANVQVQTVAEAQRRMERMLKKLFKDYQVRFEAFMRKKGAKSVSEIQGIAFQATIRRDLLKMLSDAGMDDVVGNYVKEFPEITKVTMDYFEASGFPRSLSGASKESLSAFVELTEHKIRTGLERKLVDPLIDGVFRSSFGDLDRSQIVDNLVSLSDSLTPGQVETLVNDSFLQFQRAATTQKAEELELDIFVYVGPADEITSEQCDFLLSLNEHGMDGALYKDEISADLHPLLKDNPLIAGGHFNCRHKYFPITKDLAVSEGFKA